LFLLCDGYFFSFFLVGVFSVCWWIKGSSTCCSYGYLVFVIIERGVFLSLSVCLSVKERKKERKKSFGDWVFE
jgi:hypothetical protein